LERIANLAIDDNLSFLHFSNSASDDRRRMNQIAGSIIAVAAIGIFLILGATHSNSLAEEKRQAQSTTTVCNEESESCEVSICSNENPCKTSNSPNPSNTESSMEDNEVRPQQDPDLEEQQPEAYPPNTETHTDFPGEENKDFMERLLGLSQ
jgi:hypothetical protein